MKRLKTLVIIPAYNEALNIQRTVESVIHYAPNVDYIVINDGSKDNTLDVLEKNHFNYVNGICNLGLFGAVQTGFKIALDKNYDVAIQFDGDGQHPAQAIEHLVQAIDEGNDIAIGSRYVVEKKPWTPRMIGSRLISGAIFLTTRKRIKDPTSGLRAYNRRCIKEYALDLNNPPEPDTLVYMIQRGCKVKEVQVYMNEREYGESYLNFTNTIKYMSRMMVSIFMIQPFRKR